ncbi:Fe-S-containing hydro-lyase [bacterium]|nr:Fe-S-containing hydro-lyase [bacterium]
MARLNIKTPLTKDKIEKLKAGDIILLNGTIYSARDAAHKRIMQLIEEGADLPFPIKDQIIYYMGPTPAREGKIIGSAGPTTSYRMDSFTPKLIEMGLAASIGKGSRSTEVVNALKANKAVYLSAVGGAGALLSKRIRSVKIIAFEDLGAEAVRKLGVEEFPLIVAIDSYGTSLFER